MILTFRLRERNLCEMYMCGYYISADKISVGENMEKLKASYIAGGN